jgi:acyl-CoA synthetase (AMP-forming)/AMP-acid ligase II/acyl-CoA reductase-like NAD-dependent aldehyde dehydrogenase
MNGLTVEWLTGRIFTCQAVNTSVDIEERALRMAAVLGGRGVCAGDRVMLAASNSADYVVALLALMHLDVSIVLADDRETEAERVRMARRARARWVVRGDLDESTGGADVVSLASLVKEEADATSDVDVLSFAAWNRRSDALITWSSGSTGIPKGIVRSGRGFLHDLERTRERMAYRNTDVLLPLVPFSHFYGLTLLVMSWTLGCSLAIAPLGRLDQAVKLAADSGATVLDAAPSTYHSLLKLMDRRPEIARDLASVRMFCVGGSPMPRSLAERFQERLGQPLLDGYGSNEAGNVALAAPGNAVGCGRPLPGVEVTIVDGDGHPVQAGETGEIWVQSPSLMQGYLSGDGSIEPRGDGPYRTNDLGYADADGNIVVLGRKYAVHRMGHTLYPEAIERKAEMCGRPVKIVAVSDEGRGTQLVLFVADGSGQPATELRREIAALLPDYERPNKVAVLPSFPLNRNGKPDLARLRDLAQELVAPARRPAADSDDAMVLLPGVATTGGEGDVPFPARVAGLRAVLELLRDRPEDVRRILTRISLHRAVDMEIDGAIHTLAGAVDEVLRNGPQAVRRMAVFMPSNVLLYSYVLYLLVPALFVEDIAFRPSSQVADVTRELHELLAPVHQIPIELASLSQRKFVGGPVADADVVVFTGTYHNAEAVRAQLRTDQLFMLFGQGANPFVVAPDADLDLSIDDAVRIRMLNSGQDCFGPDVFFVPEQDASRFVEGIGKRLSAMTFGDCADPAADYGPICYDSALTAVTEYLPRNAGYIVQGGAVDFRTRQVHPTILLRDFDAPMSLTELFCPVFNVVTYTDREQLRTRLTEPSFQDRAMGAMVYGHAPDLVEQLGKRHVVAVDRTLLDVDDGNRPFGGRGIMANYVSHRKRRWAQPLLISKVVADECPVRG